MASNDSEATSESPVTGFGPSGTKGGGKRKLRRLDVARILGVSESKVRRLEHRLAPTLGPGGVRLFSPERVDQVRRELERESRPDSAGGIVAAEYTGEMASTVFTMFDEGITAIEIVKRTKLHPHQVSAIIAEWTTMQEPATVGGVRLTGAEVRALWKTNRALIRYRQQGMSFAQALLEVVKECVSGCVCGRGEAMYCETCRNAAGSSQTGRST